jgi:predicted MFS family arabinose efflux permease
MTWTVLLNHRFDARKGLAIGIALAGTGIFGVFSKGLTTWLIVQFGWRGAYVGLGLLPILVAAPVAIALFHDTPNTADTPTQVTYHPGMTLAQALRDRRFWTMAFGFLIVSLALAGPVPNMENILKTAGITAATILKLTPLIGLSALSGRLIGGWFVDRFWAPAVAFVILSLPAIACWLLATATISFGIAALSILLIGFALGVEYDLMAFFIARYFGLRSYSAIYGVLYVFFSLGAGFGPLAFGVDFDRHGSYRLALITAVIVLLGAALSFLTLGRYRDFEDEVPEAPPGNLAAA